MLRHSGIFAVLLSICALMTSGCGARSNSSFDASSGSKINAENFLRIKPGMGYQEVKLILGSPTSDDYVSELKLRTMEWREGSKKITVLLQGGVVMQHNGTAAKTQDGL